MAKIFVEAYGCSASFADSEMISGLIQNGGHTLVDDSSESDLNIVVTCSVKDSTANKMMYRINSLKSKFIFKPKIEKNINRINLIIKEIIFFANIFSSDKIITYALRYFAQFFAISSQSTTNSNCS